jgi:DNA repair/transcription protein MET18/MMS19
VGCLELIRRKSDVGMVMGSDAKAIAQYFLQNLQVQSLGMYDRKVNYFCCQKAIKFYASAVK